ncbi:mechanosensitive ion channel family protein [Sebaldella sp. S0638]|uniref:mechanosensitive ion channel family protein n=1 Tax=Sebaldella sp. S0638 TaxID=2957809 RepID=UPI00209D8C53|nr:mechanosensitive ion channel domain-containing protein [Sebaldella sp. S0638]MCP1224860.1 mechanosensitive ion channel [Sebaldella sp. S0638]
MKFDIKQLTLDNLMRILEKHGLNIIVALTVYYVARYGKTYIDKAVNKFLEKSRIERSISSFIKSIYSLIYYVILFYIVIDIVGIDLSSITTLLGALGIVLGFAFKETLGNFCGGLMILVFKPFKIGHVVEYGKYTGEIISIELFYTRMKNFQNELIIIPNGIVTNNVIRNLSKNKVRRLDLTYGVGYKSDIRQVKKILDEIIAGHPKILKSPEPVARLGEMGDSALKFVVYVYVKNEDYGIVKYDLNEGIKIKFDENNIEIPFPQMDIYIGKKESDEIGS